MKYLAIVLLLALGACGFTGTGDTFKAVAKDKGAQAYDEGLDNATWFVCDAASIGSIKRRYFQTQEGADAYNGFCNTGGELSPTDDPE